MENTFFFIISIRQIAIFSRQQFIRVSHKQFALRTHNWQKWKRVLPTCPCHKIYRVDTVSLKNSSNICKNTIFVNIWNSGQFLEKSIFCQYLTKVWIWKFFSHMLIIWLQLSSAQQILFPPNQFLVIYRFPFAMFHFLGYKSPKVIQRLVSQENTFKKEQKPITFSLPNYRLK